MEPSGLIAGLRKVTAIITVFSTRNMPSREEFMRQMGISVDDVKDPCDVKSKFPSKGMVVHDSSPSPVPSGRMSAQQRMDVESAVAKKRGYHAYAEEMINNAPIAPMASQKAAPMAVANNMVAPEGSKAREAFLRSLGIDNMDTPGIPAATASTSASAGYRASQEIGSQRQSSRPAAATASHDSVGSNDDGPGPRSFMSQPAPDITLGHRGGNRASPSYGAKVAKEATESSVPHQNAAKVLLEKELEGLSVEDIKVLGNRSFEEGDYRKAIRLYTRAIERDSGNAALYSNRSACYVQAAKQMGMDTRSMALRDADKVIELRPDWFKGYSRRGDALFKLQRFHEAAEAYERGLALDPENTNLLHSLGEARNAAGHISTHERTSSWSTAPQPVENLRQAQGKSAHDLLDEMRHQLRQQSQENVALGNEYRLQQLQRFRDKGDGSRSGSSLSNPRADSMPGQGASFTSGAAKKQTKRHPYASSDDDDDAMNSQLYHQQASSSERASSRLETIREDDVYGSRAAATYQQSLLEQYRKKKATQQSSSTYTW